MVNIVDNTVLYNWNLLRFAKKVEFTCSHTHTKGGGCVNSMAESFQNVYIYQIIKLYTLNILQFYLSIIPQ